MALRAATDPGGGAVVSQILCSLLLHVGSSLLRLPCNDKYRTTDVRPVGLKTGLSQSSAACCLQTKRNIEITAHSSSYSATPAALCLSPDWRELSAQCRPKCCLARCFVCVLLWIATPKDWASQNGIFLAALPAHAAFIIARSFSVLFGVGLSRTPRPTRRVF